jgi:predicted RNase H-like HicB family nuclease
MNEQNRDYESLEKAKKCLYEAIQFCPQITPSESNTIKEDKQEFSSLDTLKFQLRLELVGCHMLTTNPHEAIIELATALLIAPKELIDLYKEIERNFFEKEPPLLISVGSSSSSPHASTVSYRILFHFLYQ